MFDMAPMSSLLPVTEMSNEFCGVLTDMERAGVAIDRVALDKVQRDYEHLQERLAARLYNLAREAVGDTPFSLSSPESVSVLVYSRKVVAKKTWAEVFNIGAERRGSVVKRKRIARHSKTQFNRLVQVLAPVQRKTKVAQCPTCKGRGKVAKERKDGSLGAVRYRCSNCSGGGITYSHLPQVAGFKQIPLNDDVTALGFSTSGATLERLARNAKGTAKEFLSGLAEYKAISSYLTNYIPGIRDNVQPDGLLHTNINQCVTATGRVSSSAPNLQNFPRPDTTPDFPLRGVFVSRWANRGGQLLEADYRQLEYRIAVELSGDKNGLQDILTGVDRHGFTSRVLTQAGQPTSRQDAKSHTFKPLYGGTTGTVAEKAYYAEFLATHPGIAAWHDALCSQALREHEIRIPSGRAYAFPNVVRYPSGTVSGATQIKNYPVQGFATGDIVPCACIPISRALRAHGLRSLFILQVHDSVLIDVFPGELEQVIPLVRAALDVREEFLRRFNYRFTVPLDIDIKVGSNWLEMKEI